MNGSQNGYQKSVGVPAVIQHRPKTYIRMEEFVHTSSQVGDVVPAVALGRNSRIHSDSSRESRASDLDSQVKGKVDLPARIQHLLPPARGLHAHITDVHT